jgi:hypothetical protein
MQPMANDQPRGRRGHLTIFAAQLLLTLVAVLVSRMDLAVRTGAAAVMAVAAVNGCLVAVYLLGVRRSGWMIWGLTLATLFAIVGLLVWPVWDVAERAGLY